MKKFRNYLMLVNVRSRCDTTVVVIQETVLKVMYAKIFHRQSLLEMEQKYIVGSGENQVEELQFPPMVASCKTM